MRAGHAENVAELVKNLMRRRSDDRRKEEGFEVLTISATRGAHAIKSCHH